MQTLLLYEPADGQPSDPADVVDAVAGLPLVELDGRPGDPYRPGRWRDPETGAHCDLDVGHPPLEEDQLHPNKAYEGWRDLGVALHLPLVGPHWLCVETLQFIEALLARLPGARALDTEDTRQEQGDGPSAWSRPRLLASWERLSQTQLQGRTDVRRMGRLASVCLWRYRRERARGRRDFPELHWPDAVALLDLELAQARSAALWQDPRQAIALPPVELLVIPRADGFSVLPAELLADLATEPLPCAQAARLAPNPALIAKVFQTGLLPAGRFRSLGDHDWTD
jgi:hypothetical protein